MSKNFPYIIFNSKKYKLYIFCVALTMAFIELYVLFSSGFNVLGEGMGGKNFVVTMLVFCGSLLKSSVVISIIYSRGPLKELLYIWGGIALVGSASHFLSVLIAGDNPATVESFQQLLLLVLGFTLTIPVSSAISYKSLIQDKREKIN